MYQLITKPLISQNIFVPTFLFAWRKDLALKFTEAFR